MKYFRLLSLSTLIFMLSISVSALSAQDDPVLPQTSEEKVENSEKLIVVWTSGDKDVAEKMVFMYVYNAKKRGWWKDITLIVWGPSAKLLSEDKGLQQYVKNMQDEGVIVKACKACADMYEVSDHLTSCGLDVKYMGVELTDYLKDGSKVVTF